MMRRIASSLLLAFALGGAAFAQSSMPGGRLGLGETPSLSRPHQMFSGGGARVISQCALGYGAVPVASCIPASSSTVTVDCGLGPLQYLENNAAFTLAAPIYDGGCDIQFTNGASAGAVTLSGFTVGSSTGDALTTTNGNLFFVHVERINGSSVYSIQAQQ